MWWARALLLALSVALAGCGFHPLYATSERGYDPDLAAVTVAPIPERMGQLLRISLRDSFNPSGETVPAKWALSVTLTTQRAEVGIRKDGTASRVQYLVLANYTLADLGGGQRFAGTARSSTAFDITQNEYALVVAENDAQRRAAEELSQQIRDRVALLLKRPATAAAR